MNKKVFIVLLLVVFMLAQFSMASAAAVSGDASITSIPAFLPLKQNLDVEWAVSGMPAAGTKYLLMWGREYPSATYDVADCKQVEMLTGLTDASGAFAYDFIGTNIVFSMSDGDVFEFTLTVDTDTCVGAPVLPAGNSVMGTVTIDNQTPAVWGGNPPSLSAANVMDHTVACNTFEYWAVASDRYGLGADETYSGLVSWGETINGTFAPTPPIGKAQDTLSWVYTFPSTASGQWTFYIHPKDGANNSGLIPKIYRLTLPIEPQELEDCATFSDVSGHADEVYIRYLATLGLINGFADGTFGPDATLTRAEAATLFEISNGYDTASLPVSAPAGCEFTDVAASDWFAGWVWQACADGFMNGVGGGLFDPNNLLTRGQVVTIMNNVANTTPSGGYLNTNSIVNNLWNHFVIKPILNAAFTDVAVGAYYAEPVIQAYGWGVADATSDTTFSPDQPVTRGEFANMLYRALSRVG